MGLSRYYGTVPTADNDRFRILTQSVDLGSTHIDTANIYGDSEDLIGRWLRSDPSLRPKIFLATKFGIATDPVTGEPAARGNAAYVTSCIESSLQRLGVDVIDLVYAHRIDKTVPIEETMLAVKQFIDAGKVRHVGLSEASAATIRRAHAVHPVAAVQVEYSPFALEIEQHGNGVLQTCRELGIAIVAYSPLGRGMLTGAYKSRDDFEEDDLRRRMV